MVASVTVRGDKEVAATMAKATKQLPELNTEAAAKIIVAASANTAPRRTGRLASGTRAVRTAKGASITNAVVYAVPIHWGRPAHNIRSQPWISDAAHATEGQWRAAIEKEGQSVCNGVHGA